ncbi:MAG TPA: AAA family ATPase, partial [Chryseolinea sp.]|nr:AAA family ATPase [Chryseolinea sp.]
MAKRVNRIVTFYSYKGGVGRSMALANVAAALAKWDYKTLVIDWDLEAPGLENYFAGYLDLEKVRSKSGVIDLLRLQLNSELVEPGDIPWGNYLNEINIGKTPLHLITAGKRDEEYIEKVRQFDYISFYQSHNGGEYLENLREHWLDQYDLILIDSRTGLTDSSGICSIHMPDILVLMFTPNEQSFYGVTEVARKAVEGQKQIIYDRFQLRTLPIPCRIEYAETMLLDEWMAKISKESESMLAWLPRNKHNEYIVTPSQLINQVRIPYKTLYAYGERLAVTERSTTDTSEIGYVYETI